MPLSTYKRKGGLWAAWVPILALFAKHIFLTLLVIAPVATYQARQFYGQLEPRFFLAPLAVSFIVGMLWGHAVLLKLRLSRQGEQFRAIADLAQEFTYYRRLDGVYEYVSPASLTITGYPPNDFYAIPNLMDLLIHPGDRERWRELSQVVSEGGEPEPFEMRLVNRDNRTVWFKHLCAPVFDSHGRQLGVRSTNLDITQRKADQAHIERMAYYDPLTDLPNRRSLVYQIRSNISRGTPDDGARFALLFLDLNRFKHINDSFGHSFGDRLLKVIAERLRSACDEECLVSRFGGDEFVILLNGVKHKEQARRLAKQLLFEVEQPLVLDGIDLHASASVGITLFPDDGTDADTLIRNADVAMYRTKRDNSGSINFYSSDLSDEATHFVTTEGMVQRGLVNGEFIAFYQPKVDLRSGRFIGLEALARWQHPERGMIAPGEFIPIAEETGQIKQLGMQILTQVLEDVHRWQELGIALPVAINVSARQFSDHDYSHDLSAAINNSGCAMTLIELEITEQVFLGDLNYAAERLQQLRSTGLSIALDDFGTGYSSFNYLKGLPIDTLKIDRSFITQIDRNTVEFAIIKALVSMCRDLRLDMVVEGVETERQARCLLELGCDKAQGFHFYKPMSAGEVEQRLLRQAGYYEVATPDAV